MDIKVGKSLQALAHSFKAAGYTLYITGGFVRDWLLYGKNTKTDIDIAASVLVEDIKQFLPEEFCLKERNSELGTVAIVSKDGEVYEYTAFRKDNYRKGGGHRPQSVDFVGSVSEDALRRDFTVNSIYFEILSGTLSDPLGGVQDIKDKILRTSDKPEVTFQCDGLRLLRLVRQAVFLDFEIEDKTKQAAKNMADNLADIVQPRINEEFFKILFAEDGEKAYRGLKLLWELGLLFIIVPELKIAEGFGQNKRWHEYDVLEHSLQTVRLCDAEIRMAALLHDIGKPASEMRYGNSRHHTQIALEISPDILRRLGYSQKRAERVLRIVEHHMYDLDGLTGENKIKRFILQNKDILQDLLALKQADFLASGKYGREEVCPTVTKWQQIFDKMKDGPTEIKDLAISPTQLIQALKGIMPQSDTAKVMQKLLDAVVVEGIKNQENSLLLRAKSYYN